MDWDDEWLWGQSVVFTVHDVPLLLIVLVVTACLIWSSVQSVKH